MKSLSLLFIALALGSGFYLEGDRSPERGEGRSETKQSFAIHDKVALDIYEVEHDRKSIDRSSNTSK
jgi:hypothetical protein